MSSDDRLLSLIPIYVFWPLDEAWSTIVVTLIWVGLGVFVVRIYRQSRRTSDPRLTRDATPLAPEVRKGRRGNRSRSKGQTLDQTERIQAAMQEQVGVLADRVPPPSQPEKPSQAGMSPGRPTISNLVLVPASGTPTIPLQGQTITIGRDLSNAIVVASPKASRRHARLERHAERWYLIDERQSSGTRVNNQLIPKGDADANRQIRPGDVIEIGTVLYRVAVEGDAGAAPPDQLSPSAVPEREARISVRSASPTLPSAWSVIFGDATTRGDRRANNDVLVARGNRVALADVAGDDAVSEVTSKAVRSALTEGAALTDLSLLGVVNAVNNAIVRASQDNHDRHPMLSTLDVLGLGNRRDHAVVEVAHIGDGTVFYAPSGSDYIEQITEAHTAAPGSPTLVKWVGTRQGQAVPPQPDGWVKAAASGDRFVIATDGFTSALGDRLLDALREALADGPKGAPAPQTVAERLVRIARDTHRAAERDDPGLRSLDNITVVVAEVAVANPAAARPR